MTVAFNPALHAAIGTPSTASAWATNIAAAMPTRRLKITRNGTTMRQWTLTGTVTATAFGVSSWGSVGAHDGAYTGACNFSDGATWLLVVDGSADSGTTWTRVATSAIGSDVTLSNLTAGAQGIAFSASYMMAKPAILSGGSGGGSSTIAARGSRFIDSAMAARIDAHRVANSTAWQKIKEAADAAVAYGSTTGDPGHVDQLQCAALYYKFAGGSSYSTRVATVLDAYCTDPATLGFFVPTYVSDWRNLTRDAAFDFRLYYPAVARAFDWAYDALSPTLRTKVAKWLMDWADYMFTETSTSAQQSSFYWTWTRDMMGISPYDTPSTMGTVRNNYYWADSQVHLGWISAWGDDPATVGSNGYTGPRPQKHKDLYDARWTLQIQPMFEDYTQLGMGGGQWPESTNYEAMHTSSRVAWAMYTAFGDTNLISHQFMLDHAAWRVAQLMPSRTNYARFGDMPVSRTSDRGFLQASKDIFAASVPGLDSTTKGRLYTIANLVGLTGSGDGYNNLGQKVDWIMLYDLAATPVALEGAPLSFYGPPGGYQSYRQDWTATASYLLWQLGVGRDNHQDKAAGNVTWKKGASYLIGVSDVYMTSESNSETGGFNVLTVQHGSVEVYQKLAGSYADRTANILWHDCIEGDYAAGATECGSLYAYGYDNTGSTAGSTPGGTPYVSDNCRKMVYLHAQDALVVFDRVGLPSGNASDVKIWRWWGSSSPTIAGQNFTIQNTAATYKLYGQYVSGSPTLAADNHGPMGMVDTHIGGYYVKASRTGALNDTLVCVMQAAAVAAGSATHAVEALTSVGGDAYRGSKVGSAAVLFSDDDATHTGTTYETNSTIHYLTNCVPSRAYTITQQPSGGGSTEATISATASASGILKFTSANGATKRFVVS